MKSKATGGIVFGILIMLFAVGAFFSGEPAASTNEGKITILIVFGFGGMMILNALKTPPTTTEEKQASKVNIFGASVESVEHCKSCGKTMKANFNVCPYCGASKQLQCPSCHGAIEADYKICPTCGHHLKD